MLGVLYYYYSRKRISKENGICKNYGYNVRMLTYINVISKHLIVSLLLLCAMPFLCNEINTYALQLNYEKFLSVNYLYVFAGLFVSMVYSFLLEAIYGGVNHG